MHTFAHDSMYEGTHDIRNAEIVATDNMVSIITSYFEYSSARGALYIFIFITSDGEADLAKSALVALNRNASYDYSLPLDLSVGQYRILTYDIEQDGTLSNGIGYPAVTQDRTLSNDAGTHEQSSYMQLDYFHNFTNNFWLRVFY